MGYAHKISKGVSAMTHCPYCKGEMLKIQTTTSFESAVLQINRVYMCRRCKRVYTKTVGYKRVHGVPLNAEVSALKAGGL